MENLNPYDQTSFEQKFKKTKIFELLDQKYDEITFAKFYEPIISSRYITPRQNAAMTIVSAVPFYYLQYLDQSVQMVDLGCGINFFKTFFPNVLGIGAEQGNNFFGDLRDFVDDDFYKGHESVYYSVFSINALHFHPLEKLQDICIKFSNTLQSGGRGFLAMNVQRMLERTELFNDYSLEDLDLWIRSQFKDFPTKIVVFDVDLSQQDAWMDGNIRIVFEK
jgi:hypothetical protein